MGLVETWMMMNLAFKKIKKFVNFEKEASK
jgi:hypothetical protein